MANGTKTYEIKINGIQESVNAVDSLNKQLNDLEQRINTLNSKGITVKQSGGGSALEEQDKLQKQILATEEKLAQVRDENYKTLLHMKEELKEYSQIAKSQVAAEANQQGLFDQNTMFGLKAQLKSIKTEMQTVEIGSDRFQELTQQANELNNKLKEIEQSYGQFGRNVGNYADGVAKGMQAIRVSVNGVDREFKNAREASRALGNELKSMAYNGQRGTKEYKELQKTVSELDRTFKDAKVSSQAMNNVLHTMQSFVGIGQISQGFGAVFGFDDSEIQRSIQRLVGLQNAMMGIERINQQINERTGIGKWLAGISTGVDKAVASMLKFNTALLGTSRAAKVAATGIKAFGTALKVAISGGILLAIDAAINAFSKLVDYMKNGSKEIQAVKEATEAGTEAYAKAKVEIDNLTSKLNSFNGTKKEEQHLVEELNSKYGESIGQYKSLAEWKQALIDKAPAYLEMMKKEAELQVWINKLVEAQVKLKEIQWKQQNTMLGQFAKWISDKTGWRPTTDALNKDIEMAGAEIEKLNADINKLMSDNKIGNYAPHIEKNGKKTKNAIKDITNDIYKAEIDAMKDGLNKKLMQLEEEKRQTLNKLKQNGQATAENIRKIEEAFYKKRNNIINDYLRNLTESVKKTAAELKQTKFELNINEIEQDIAKLDNMINDKLGSKPLDNPMLASRDGSFVYEATNEYGDRLFRGTDNLTESLNLRLKALTDYDNDVLEEIRRTYHKINTLRDKQTGEELSAATAQTETEFEAKKEEIRKELEAAEEASNALLKIVKESGKTLNDEQVKQYNESIVIVQQKKDQIAELETQYGVKMEQIQTDYDLKRKQNLIEENESIRAITDSYYNGQIENLRDFLSKANSIVSQQPTMDKGGWQIINVGATQEQFDEVKAAANAAIDSIIYQKAMLKRDLDDGLISPESYNAIMRQFYDIETEVKHSLQTVETNERNLLSNFQQSINQYIQAGLDAIKTVMDSLNQYQDYQFDREEEMLDKQNELIENKLSEQADIVEKYKDKVDSIEDELATSRGDRRQHLIDQLNAEIAAQRNAQKEEQKLQKQKDALAKKQEQLDKERKKAEYKRNLMNILISTAMATANGLATQPFVPVGIAMGALATSLGMVQYALAAKQKPYAKGGQLDGGVAVGARHRDGGIKVLGGMAEIEGGEYVTNRLTTAKNIDLLSYINSKKKRIDISDMIDFYNSGKVRTSIKNVRSKFEDGGYIPTLPASLDISDQLQNIVINQDNRPIVVSVVDINNKQEDVRRVQALAGL